MSGAETEQFLAGLITRLVMAMTASPVDEQTVMEVAAELVAHDLTGSRSIGRSVEVLARGLPRLPQLQDLDGLDTALLRVFAALSSGYAEALRRRTLDEQEQMAQALLVHAKLEAENRFREVFWASTVGLAISTFNGIVAEANHAFAEIVGLPQAELTGAVLLELLRAEDDTGLVEAYGKITNGHLPRFWYRRHFTAATGEVAWTHLGASLLHDAYGVPTHHLTVVENITELHLLRQELARQTLYDMLTGLPNERYLMSRLQEVLGTAGPSTVTLCRLNLDNFSVINDGLGRAAGDTLVHAVAERLVELVDGQPAMVARLGGDDFAILLEDDPDSPEPEVLGPRINETLSEPVYYENHGLALSASVGIVRRAAHGLSPEELIRSANTTMHRAKRIGGGQWSLYDAEADALDWEILQLAAEMPGAFEIGEITIRYQPVCELDGGRIVAIQPLLRWERTDDTVVEHPTCLALAEQSGLLSQLGRWIVQESCHTASTLVHNPALSAPLLRVDLTTQLSQDPDLVTVVRDALSTTGLPMKQLRLGIPLVALVHGRGDVLNNVSVLGELGIEMVMLCNAAGPEYLAYLEDLPLRGVEIFPEVVTRIADRSRADSVVAQALRQSIPLMHSTGVTAIVPGVDTPEQATWWRSTGADYARGTYFSPPVCGSELPDLLTTGFLGLD